MVNMYAFLASIAQQLGVLFFMTVFGLVCFYALRPRNAALFHHAAQAPLNEDDRP